jgi:MFS family permease
MQLELGGLWRHRDFRLLWAGQTISVFGSLTTHLALPLTAILYLHASALEVVLLTSTDMVAGLIVGLFAGAIADRMRRRSIMIAVDIARAGVLVTVPLAAAFGELAMPQLYAVRFLAGGLTVMFDVAYQAYLPTLVEEHELIEGNGKLTASASVAEFSAFSASGWFVQLLSAPGAILIDACTFVASAWSLLRIDAREPAPRPAHERDSVRTEIATGLRAVRDDRVLRALAVSWMSLSLVSGLMSSIFLLYTTRQLGFSPGVLGVIFGVGGVTAFFGAVLSGWTARRFGSGGAIIIGLAMGATGILLTSAATDASLFAAMLLVVQQIISDPGWTVYEINQVSLRQAIAPPDVLGRINGAMQVAGMAAFLVGTGVAGVVAELVSPRAVVVVAAGVGYAGALYMLTSPARSARAPVRAQEVTAEAVLETG